MLEGAADKVHAKTMKRRIISVLLLLALSIQCSICQNIDELKKKAEKGHIEAQIALGRAIMTGTNTRKDEIAGARWIAKAADQNSAMAKFLYGVFLTYGIGVSKDPKRAVKLLDETVDPKDPKHVEYVWDAYIQLAETGYFKNDDPEAEAESQKLTKWTFLAAQNGIPKAQCLAAEMLHEGFGVRKDLGRAAKLMREAAKGGCKPACSSADKYEYDAMNPIQRWMADKKKEKLVEERKKKIQDIQKKRKESEVVDLLREIRDQNAELLKVTQEASEQVNAQPQNIYVYDDSSDQIRRENQDSFDDIQKDINQAAMWDAAMSRLYSR